MTNLIAFFHGPIDERSNPFSHMQEWKVDANWIGQ